MRRPGDPPSEAEEPAARLFRILLAPRPERRLKTRIRGAEQIPLLVRAIRPSERLEAIEAAEEYPQEIRSSRRLQELVSRCLWAGDARAFPTADDLGALDGSEIDALAAEAIDALSRISPAYGADNIEAWVTTLERGASAHSNLADAFHLGSCVDHGYGGISYRPDRYWGVPIRELLDGHWMAFRAARAVVHKYSSKR